MWFWSLPPSPLLDTEEEEMATDKLQTPVLSPKPKSYYHQLPLETRDMLKRASVVGCRGDLAGGCWSLCGVIRRRYGLRK